MARINLLARLAGNSGALANARSELELAHQRATAVDLLARRIETRTRPASTPTPAHPRRTPAAT